MKKIPLTRGLVALVDDEDYAAVAQFKWHASSKGYACRSEGSPPHKRAIYLHRFLMQPRAGMQVDHISRDRLDCRRANMRVATPLQNMWNIASQRLQKPKTSKYRGVHLGGRAGRKRWTAQITINGRVRHLGCFNTEMEAALAYDRACLESRGEFACLNVPRKSA